MELVVNAIPKCQVKKEDLFGETDNEEDSTITMPPRRLQEAKRLLAPPPKRPSVSQVSSMSSLKLRQRRQKRRNIISAKLR